MNIDATTTDAETKTVTLNSSVEEVVVQYVVGRGDLIDMWPLGSVVTHGCHASVAAIRQHKDDPATLSYFSPSSLDSMQNDKLRLSTIMKSSSQMGFYINFRFSSLKIFLLVLTQTRIPNP
ncbi:putative peptidyl-tRNA hydrolase PTRHD1, partial [Bienertia sinuspersici]